MGGRCSICLQHEWICIPICTRPLSSGRKNCNVTDLYFLLLDNPQAATIIFLYNYVLEIVYIEYWVHLGFLFIVTENAPNTPRVYQLRVWLKIMALIHHLSFLINNRQIDCWIKYYVTYCVISLYRSCRKRKQIIRHFVRSGSTTRTIWFDKWTAVLAPQLSVFLMFWHKPDSRFLVLVTYS